VSPSRGSDGTERRPAGKQHRLSGWPGSRQRPWGSKVSWPGLDWSRIVGRAPDGRASCGVNPRSPDYGTGSRRDCRAWRPALQTRLYMFVGRGVLSLPIGATAGPALTSRRRCPATCRARQASPARSRLGSAETIMVDVDVAWTSTRWRTGRRRRSVANSFRLDAESRWRGADACPLTVSRRRHGCDRF
jgi:hypothetical protein